MATPNYDVNYNDERFTKVNNEKTAALSEMEKTYGGMISDSDGFYQQQIDATERWGQEQKKNQQAQTDFAIDKIEQQKAQAQQDYIKEQSGAYTDWQKQSNPYGVDAEKKADMGMANSGYSESAKVAMYTAYQNRVVAAREVFNRAVLNYDNAIKDATLQNNSALAQIAYETLQKSLELGLQGFQYKNTLILEKANKKTELEQIYHSRYQDVLDQINRENALKEEVRQHNEQMAEEKRQFNQNQDLARRQLKAQKENQAAQLALERDKFEWQKAQAAKDDSGGGGGDRVVGQVKGGKPNDPKPKETQVSNTKYKGGSSMESAMSYLNALIASGASNDRVANEISLALRKGEITKADAIKLRQGFTPRGVRY